MLRGPRQALFWLMFFALLWYGWIFSIGVYYAFFSPVSTFPEHVIRLFFVLYGFLTISVLPGLVMAIFLDNAAYIKRFSLMVMVVFASFMAAKGMYG